MYAHANDIHEIDILCWFQVHIHQPTHMPVLFCLAFSTVSTNLVMNVFNCFYGLCLNPLTGVITKFCIPTIKHLLRRFKICLNLPSEQIIFVFPPVHLSSLRCTVNSSFRVNICLQLLHSHRLQSRLTSKTMTSQ